MSEKINQYRVLTPINYAAVLQNVGAIVAMSEKRAAKYGAAIELIQSDSKESK